MHSIKQRVVSGLIWKKKTFRVALLSLTSILAIQIFTVNMKWPAPELTKIPVGEKALMNGLSLCVTDSSIVSPKEFYTSYAVDKKQQTRLTIEQMTAQGGQARVLCITILSTNETEHAITFQADELMAECGPWSARLDSDLFQIANNSVGTLEIAPSESKEIRLFYDLYYQHFDTSAWENIETLPFALTVSLYPQKILLCV